MLRVTCVCQYNMRSRTRNTHESKTEWVDLPILVPSQPGTRDGDFWEFVEQLTAGAVSDPGSRWKLDPKPVRVVPASEFTTQRAAIPKEWRKHLNVFFELTQAVEGGQKDVQTFAERNVEAEYVNILARDPRAWLVGHLNAGVRAAPVRFGLWKDKRNGSIRAGLVCTSELSVPFALVAYNLASARGMRVCRRERCGKSFHSTRPQQTFCSTQCRHADQQKRYRERHARD
jgi:hypothetical protein